MTVIELHRDFSERYPYARSPEKKAETHWGQIDNIILDAAWDLVVATLQRWNSQAQYICGLFAQYDKNSEAALHWFKKSAAQGNERAIKALKELGEKLK